MWIPNLPVLLLQIIFVVVGAISAYKDNKYFNEIYLTGKFYKRVNFWYILYHVCIVGFILGLIAQAFSYMVEYAP